MPWEWVDDCQCWLDKERDCLIWQDVLTHKWHGIWKAKGGMRAIAFKATAEEAMIAIDKPVVKARRGGEVKVA